MMLSTATPRAVFFLDEQDVSDSSPNCSIPTITFIALETSVDPGIQRKVIKMRMIGMQAFKCILRCLCAILRSGRFLSCASFHV
jgi:hypothetical protein